MRFYVKSHFNGWHRVSEEQYKKFIQNIEKRSMASRENRMRFIRERTRVEEDENDKKRNP